ncbi:NAD(P)-dependent oxidoreductase [Paucibacter sp. B2R-40]|uniref:NAD-dependent epimerase/dehydratase family protein n=1 Tax=Paucibacter sp. B2R-40 TaxID=2893554 RepID=UPI0021E3A6CD|nr:NAD(P)-dependent oxidoreductase [Paucibacter sp. B2R-40]MCV2354323.1 NAD(P)-dependent oxidoreductase [Paucibacter sp. B2R-40]
MSDFRPFTAHPPGPSNERLQRLQRLLLTGAAGTLGRMLRPRLQASCELLLLSDRISCGEIGAHENEQICDLADRAAMLALLQGVDGVVHLGGVSVENPFEQVAASNLHGVFNLYEAARLSGCKRIVFASSNHTIGCYEQGQPLSVSDKPRPDGYYGVSKLFGENMAQLYWDRYGIETVSLRIGTATPEPEDRRALSTWLSPNDLERLVRAALFAPDVGCLTVYGVSANSERWWSAEGWDKIGYAPQDNAEAWRERVQGIDFAAGSPMARLQGGRFLGLGPFEPQAQPQP